MSVKSNKVKTLLDIGFILLIVLFFFVTIPLYLYMIYED